MVLDKSNLKNKEKLKENLDNYRENHKKSFTDKENT